MTTATPTNTHAIELHGLVHRYGPSFVLRGADLVLARGQTLVMYGANGAGKTTLLRIIATALSPTRGTGQVLGHDIVREKILIRAKTLIVSHALGLYPELNATENLEFALEMSGHTKRKSETTGVLTRVGLGNTNARIRAYSSGMRKRLALAKMLLLRPELVLLDEPFAALDPNGKNMVDELLTEEKQRGTTIVFTSHEPERAAQLANQHLSLENGLLLKN